MNAQQEPLGERGTFTDPLGHQDLRPKGRSLGYGKFVEPLPYPLYGGSGSMGAVIKLVP